MIGKLHSGSKAFIEFLEAWREGLPHLELGETVRQPETVVIISMDMINGFCKFGPLASPRVNALIQPICDLFQASWEMGVRHFILSQDTHDPNALEFDAFAPHCVRGTPEAETVDEFKALQFFDQMIVFEKNTISSSLDTGLEDWIDRHPEVETYIIVGDCTDICVYQSALQLRLQANAKGLNRRVLVPQNCVDTYDLPVAAAREIGILPHDGELLHHVFLYHMALNAVEVIEKFTW